MKNFHLFKLKALRYYLIDILETQSLNNLDRKWYEEYYYKIDKLLEGGKDHFASAKYLYRLVTYRQKVKDLHAGNFYASRMFSYSYLSKEIRGLLINNKNYF